MMACFWPPHWLTVRDCYDCFVLFDVTNQLLLCLAFSAVLSLEHVEVIEHPVWEDRSWVLNFQVEDPRIEMFLSGLRKGMGDTILSFRTIGDFCAKFVSIFQLSMKRDQTHGRWRYAMRAIGLSLSLTTIPLGVCLVVWAVRRKAPSWSSTPIPLPCAL
jgi:hypothetical protein